MIAEYIKARWGEVSTKIGLILSAAGGAAAAASALNPPWSYIAFAAPLLLVIFPGPGGK